MDRLLAVAGNGGQPLRSTDWEFVQNVQMANIKAVIQSLTNQVVTCIVTGMQTYLNQGKTHARLGEGFIYVDGEVFYVPEAEFDLEVGKVFYIAPNFTTSENRAFKDGSTHDVYALRRYQYGYDAEIPSGGISYISLPTLISILTQEIVDNLPETADIGIRFRTESFDSRDLGRACQFIPTPGEGKMIKIITCSMTKVTGVKLEVGSQQLNVCYGTDPTSEDIGHFSNQFLEDANDTPCDMIPKPGNMYPNQPVSVGLSAESDPISGDARITLYALYKEITIV
jgi:hypothetical protein